MSAPLAKTPPKSQSLYSTITMRHPNNAQSSYTERDIQNALRAIQQDANLSIKRAAQLYNVPRTTLSNRRAGTPSRRDYTPKTMSLTLREEEAIVQYILDLGARGFPPQLAAVKDMADSLRAERGQKLVGRNWAANFVKRKPELQVKFNRKYDYKRALCEDSEAISGWFRLVENMKAKHGILDQDTYNFDESGFMMGVISTGAVVTGREHRGRPKGLQPGNREWTTVIQGICATGWALPPYIIFPGKHHLSAWYKDDTIPSNWVIQLTENGWTNNQVGLEWLKHFDAHTKKRTVGTVRLLIMDSHESHDSLPFQQYCKENKIITLCMPPHLSHLLQPLDVGCFAPLKVAYGRQVEHLMRNRITHITKLEFLPCFKQAFFDTFRESVVQSGF
jgi:hypothetical protein